MRNTLQAITAELRRLKAAGVTTVPVDEATLHGLRQWVAGRAAQMEKNALARVATPAAEPVSRNEIPDTYQPPATFGQKTVMVPKITPDVQLPSAPSVKLPEGDKQTRWDALLKLVTEDEVCRSHVREGKKVVLGVGNLDASIMFVGEAPGAEEEVQGEPFVGPAGQLLTKMILAMGLKREDVYIGNIMNWRPQMPTPPGREQVGNRPPSDAEMAYCLPYLRAQIEVVQPKLLVALGSTAAQGLLGAGSFKSLGEVRGRWHDFAGKPVMVTYHPSYILRNQSNRSKRAIWEDLLQVMERAELPITEKQRGYFL